MLLEVTAKESLGKAIQNVMLIAKQKKSQLFWRTTGMT
jgi:hypothetical protein